jgi:hypothetical protein
MSLNQWSNRSVALIAVICALGGFALQSSLTQESRGQESRSSASLGEVGRYQYIVAARGGDTIIDTKTGTLWQRRGSGVDEESAPWTKRANDVGR